MTTVGRSSNYRDPEGWTGSLDGVEWRDPLERAAIVLRAMSYMTPADAVSAATGTLGKHELAHSWCLLDPSARQLWRRRADSVVDVYTTGGTP